ncbi:LPXTG cell wall anchor domain-containing protein [Erysipelothrix anatis]|uniref:LPXTG cell wall anchor domain-containing protein n=1 Tax=Erysipelothrix anatis TaxID=2683713 RepID=UPI0039EC2A29
MRPVSPTETQDDSQLATLPATGQVNTHYVYGVGALIVISGFLVIIYSKRKKA